MVTTEFRHLRYLLAVAEHGSFTRAAAELHISQPTLSQQIRQLERAVGVPLLDRSGRSVRLTDGGTAYAQHARRALLELAAAERAVHDVADLTRGHLRLAVTPTFTTYLVGPLIAELYSRHPGITVALTETNQDLMEARLLADDLDIGIAFAGSHLPGIAATELLAETLSLVVARGPDPAPTPRRLTVGAIGDRDLALLSVDFATRGHIDDYLRRHRVRPRIAMEANSIQAVIETVQRSALATVLPDAITREHANLDVVRLDPPLVRTVVLLARSSAPPSAAGRAFTGLAADWAQRQGGPPGC